MKKVAKIGISILLVLLVVGAGVWALTAYVLDFGGKIKFDVDPNVSVTFEGTIKLNGEEILSSGQIKSLETSNELRWEIPDITFIDVNDIITYEFKFTNTSKDPIDVTIISPDDFDKTILALYPPQTVVNLNAIARNNSTTVRYELKLIAEPEENLRTDIRFGGEIKFTPKAEA